MSDGLQLKIFEGGYCVHPGFVVKPGSGLKPRAFPAAVALIKHPEHGYVLFDTGYHQHFFDATRTFPERFYAWTTPCHLQHGEDITAQLGRMGIETSQVSHLVLSHFHADHIAAVREFGQATIHCARAGFDALRNRGRFSGVRKGYLRQLIPDEIQQQLQFHDQFECRIDTLLPQLHGVELYCKDLFDDGALYLVNLPGHAAGQVGLLIRLQTQWIFLLADACWLIESLRDNLDQHWLANIICDDTKAYRQTLAQLRLCYRLGQADIRFVPSHCLTSIRSLCEQGWIR
ncbi:MBL fold metallo-hydrolase [Vibrio rhizosphaerae]|uniref:MBL fold metallo-hydrolase n=1 Tax=Vibrio rhizosphaerae TaxID=398736 RepID=A0ABU4IV67_9VIBR|nr:MBL fold metallo-hydrolase [Vibrio rhizosphaerae]MDW6093164.1 MBL fold metallo-hydrolase [Vibrio rhizosphaerae]